MHIDTSSRIYASSEGSKLPDSSSSTTSNAMSVMTYIYSFKFMHTRRSLNRFERRYGNFITSTSTWSYLSSSNYTGSSFGKSYYLFNGLSFKILLS